MSFDSLQALRSAGMLQGKTPEAVEEAFRSLSASEVEFLLDLKARVDAAVPEVVAHSVGDEEDTPCIMGMMIVVN